MSICKTSIGGDDYPSVLKETGLVNTYQVGVDISLCTDSVERTNYTLSGTCKLITGLTESSPCVYNLSEVDDFDITFDFDDTTLFTGHSGNFHYFGYDSLNNYTISFTDNISFSDITGNTLTQKLFSNDLPQIDTSIYVKSRDIYRSNCSNTVVNTYALDTPSFGFDDDYDWYMVTLVNPITPILDTPESQLSENNIDLINEQLIQTLGSLNTYRLSLIPNGSVSVYLNGILVNPSDYQIIGGLNVVFNSDIDMVPTDIVTAIYITGDNLVNSVFDELLITGITSGVTSSASSVNQVYYNTTNSRYEYFLTQSPLNTTDIQLFLNGVQLINNQEFFLSNTIPNKIIFGVGIDLEVGEHLMVQYLIPIEELQGVIGTVTTLTPELGWSVGESYNDGIFTVEVYDVSDSGHTTILYSATTEYINNVYNYSAVLGPVNVDEEYRFRVNSEKYFTDIMGNSFTTNSVSDDGFFDTKDPNLINTYP